MRDRKGIEGVSHKLAPSSFIINKIQFILCDSQFHDYNVALLNLKGVNLMPLKKRIITLLLTLFLSLVMTAPGIHVSADDKEKKDKKEKKRSGAQEIRIDRAMWHFISKAVPKVKTVFSSFFPVSILIFSNL